MLVAVPETGLRLPQPLPRQRSVPSSPLRLQQSSQQSSARVVAAVVGMPAALVVAAFRCGRPWREWPLRRRYRMRQGSP